MAPLITQEEALQLGALTDPKDIEALVERAWQARLEHFGDATDMCSLVNAKSGGCAEDCGFCAQSRFADAETPMHAMMEPEQILEHARAAEAAGAHRFCMVTQGQGLSKRDFEKYLEGVRLVSEQTNLKRCASIGHMSVDRARQLKEAGVQRVHHNVETAESYYDEVATTVKYEGRLRTIQAVQEAGLETCVGGILNMGETPEQRVEMAFQLAAVNPTSVPINLLIPKAGTKFGDREIMNPWEAVQWVAIFRLILPEALFRLCGGRVQNLAELQPLAVKAGVNGVMMGNFLTTLGNTPAEDREMFTDLGLNIARQPDNGSNPRPDNRSGWLEGQTPDIVETYLDDAGTIVPEDLGATFEVRLWDPSKQLRFKAKDKTHSRAPRRGVQRVAGGASDRGALMSAVDIERHLDDLEDRGLHRRLRLISGPQGPRVVLDGKPVLLLCSNNYLGLADHPRVREAAADAAMRWGVGAGASRLVSGSMRIHRKLEERLAAFKGARAALLFGSGYMANIGVIGALAGKGDIVFSDELNHASIIDGCKLSGAKTFVYRHNDVDHLSWALQRAEGRGALIVTDSVFSMDGDIAPLTEIVELARRHDVRVAVDEAHGVGCVGPGGRGVVHEAGLEHEVDVVIGTLGKALGSYGAYVTCEKDMADYLVNTARPFIFSTAPSPPAVAGALAALELLIEEPRRVERLEANSVALRGELAREGFDVSGSATQIVPLVIGDASLAMRICEQAIENGVFAQAIRPPTVPQGTSRLRIAVMGTHSKDELREAARVLGRAALQAGFRPGAGVPVAAAGDLAEDRAAA